MCERRRLNLNVLWWLLAAALVATSLTSNGTTTVLLSNVQQSSRDDEVASNVTAQHHVDEQVSFTRHPDILLAAKWSSLFKNNKNNITSKGISSFVSAAAKVHSSSPDDVILATHLSTNKFDRLEILLRWWNGPSSVALWIRSDLDIQIFADFYHAHAAALARTTFHFYLEHPLVPDSDFYPHNILRNLAVHQAPADFVLGVDVDFVPPPDAHDTLLHWMERANLHEQMRHRKQLYVLPVFEILPPNSSNTRYAMGSEDDLPKTREELLDKWNRQEAREWHWPPGHLPSKIDQWLQYNHTGNTTTTMISYPIKPKPRYEPYFIGHRPSLPRYWEGFRGYALNKQSFLVECVLAGLKFQGLYPLWLAHVAHPSNYNMTSLIRNRKEWNGGFAPYLQRTYHPSKKIAKKWLTLP